MSTYFFIHQWLGDRWLIALVVSSAAVTHDIDDYVFAKFHPIVERELGHEQY